MIEYLNVLYVSLCIIQLITDKQNKGLRLVLVMWLLLPQPDFIKQDVTLFITYNQLSQVLLFLFCAFISKTRIHRLLFLSGCLFSIIQTLFFLYPLILPYPFLIISSHRLLFELLISYTKSIKLSIVFMTIIFISYLL
jgi:hypothetical protein